MPRLPTLVLTLTALAFGPQSVFAVQSGGVSMPQVLTPSSPDASLMADSLLLSMEPLAAFEIIEARLEFEPTDYEALWRAARLAVALGVIEREESDRVSWFRVAEYHGLAALEARPGDLEGLVWTAAAKGRLAIETGGARDKARLGSEVWDLTEQILEEFPDHAMGNDVRGKLNQEVMKLDGFSRFMGRMVLRSDPIRYSRWDAAETHLQRAIESDSGMVLFYMDLGETYLFQEKREQAREVFETGLRVPYRFPTDPVFKRTMQRHLRRLDEPLGNAP